MTLDSATDPAPLFTPYALGSTELANRFVMAPMTRQFSPGGVPGADVAAYYARRAPHVGLIVTEARTSATRRPGPAIASPGSTVTTRWTAGVV